MHLFFYIRGINNWVETWKVMAQGLFWRWDRTNLITKKLEQHAVQGALRPSILGAWEYIFPEEALPDVLTVFGITKGMTGGMTKQLKLGNLAFKTKLAGMRKLFGAKKIPKEAFAKAETIQKSVVFNESYRALSHLGHDIIPGIAIHPIGIKEDIRGVLDHTKTGGGKWDQEML